MSEATVINLASGEPVTLIKKLDGYCMSHGQNVLIDPHLRQLSCRECGGVVDAYAWAEKMALNESHLLTRIFHLKSEASIHDARLEELKAEEQRVKARIRAAKDSLLKTAGI